MLNSKDILLQIIIEASDRNISIGKTQLVKMLYLVEVEYYRVARERLTGLTWLFYHYGPYALELEEILAHPEFAQEQFKTQEEKDFIRFRVAEERIPYGWKVDAKISLLVKRIVGEWKGKTLRELLDYVYFETEPMLAVKRRGEVLDFDTIRAEGQSQSVVPMKASKDAEQKVAELRASMKSYLESAGETHPQELKLAPDYFEALKAWDEDERPDITIPPGLIVQITNPNDESANQGT